MCLTLLANEAVQFVASTAANFDNYGVKGGIVFQAVYNVACHGTNLIEPRKNLEAGDRNH